MKIEFEDLDLYCKDDQLVKIPMGNTTTSECPFTEGEDVLEARDVLDIDVWTAVLVLYGMVLLLRVIGFVAMYAMRRP